MTSFHFRPYKLFLILAPLLSLALGPAGGALPAQAAGVLTTDAASYVQGDLVHLTFTNEGTESIFTNTSPPLGIMHVATEEWVLCIGGLPEVMEIEPDKSLFFTHDTDYDGPDPLGLYSCLINYFYEEWVEAHQATVEYLLEEPVSVPAATWGQVKCLFR